MVILHSSLISNYALTIVLVKVQKSDLTNLSIPKTPPVFLNFPSLTLIKKQASNLFGFFQLILMPYGVSLFFCIHHLCFQIHTFEPEYCNPNNQAIPWEEISLWPDDFYDSSTFNLGARLCIVIQKNYLLVIYLSLL